MTISDSSAEGVISSAAWQALVEMIGDDAPQQVVEFVDLYLDQAQQQLARMNEALDHGDGDALLLAVHSLKSGSALVGALELSGLCAEMEQALRTGAVAFDATAALAAIEAAHGRARQALGEVRRAFAAHRT